VLFGAMAPAFEWNEAQGDSLADRNPYVGAQAIDEGVFGRYGGTRKHSGTSLDTPFCHVYRFDGDRIVSFQQYTDTEQWARVTP